MGTPLTPTPIDDRFFSELLRMLLDDLRPPLVGITDSLGAMQLLHERGEYSTLAQLSRGTLYQSERLLSVIDTLLNMMRDGVVKLLLDSCAIGELVGRAAAAFPTEQINIRNGLPERVQAIVDMHLFTQLLVDVFEILHLCGERELIVSMLPNNTANHLTLTIYAPNIGAMAETLSILFSTPPSIGDRRRITRLALFCRLIMAAHTVRISFEGGGALQVYLSLPISGDYQAARRVDVGTIWVGLTNDESGASAPLPAD